MVRNPFTRIVGLWFHLVDWCRYNGDGCCGFREFVRMVYAGDAEHLSWMYRYTISRWLGDTAVDVVLRYESLAVDLAPLVGQPISLREPVQRMRREMSSYYDEETISLVLMWGAKDSSTWRYSRPF